MLFSMLHCLAPKQYTFPLVFFPQNPQITAYPVHGVDPNFCGVTHSLFIRYCNILIVLPV